MLDAYYAKICAGKISASLVTGIFNMIYKLTTNKTFSSITSTDSYICTFEKLATHSTNAILNNQPHIYYIILNQNSTATCSTCLCSTAYEPLDSGSPALVHPPMIMMVLL